ncbi:MAG: UDP-N-acetylmuramoyl-tripeptide--D-alanyl-D-alanine ligase [Burkholderiales bacterium]|nr:UDP-N-acetylmuramoyl-tripeptide--D-alanyl-D-alanine ligase [Burkholderiales bacterium]
MNDIMLTLADAAKVLSARLTGDGAAAYTHVGTDSRAVKPGELFVALAGEQFDGHDFVEQALKDGAVGAIVQAGRSWPAGLNLIEVPDTLAALTQLAADWRLRFSMPVIAVTGTNGKTTVKEMIAAILRKDVGEEAVLATAGNLNNHIGLPLMLLRLRAHHRYAVLEMGMNHFGEIRHLTLLGKPNVALVNNAGAGHLEYLGSVEGVARAKGEIYEGLAANGVAILNADDEFAPYWRQCSAGHRTLEFGFHDAAVTAEEVELAGLGSRFMLHSPVGEVAVALRVPGVHNVRNALAAAAAAMAVGLDASEIAAGLAAYNGTKGRLQQKATPAGGLVIDDTYNANPNSMRAAIDVLARQPAPQLLVLGDMGEVGAEIEARHAEVGAYARQVGIGQLYAVGENMRHAVEAFGAGAHWYGDQSALIAALAGAVDAKTTVLVKGSRFMKMERVVEALTHPAGQAGGKV